MNIKDTYFILSPYKPMKLVFEGDSQDGNIEIKKPTNYMIYPFIVSKLKHMLYKKDISTQQYKSEKGKINKGCQNEVLNFIKKRNLRIYNDILYFINTEEEHTVFTNRTEIKIQNVKTNFGILSCIS